MPWPYRWYITVTSCLSLGDHDYPHELLHLSLPSTAALLLWDHARIITTSLPLFAPMLLPIQLIHMTSWQPHLVFQNNEMVAMLGYQDNPVGIELFSYVNVTILLKIRMKK